MIGGGPEFPSRVKLGSMSLLRCLVLAYAVLLCPFAVSPAAAAQGGACAPYSKAIKLNFKTLTPATIYNNRLSITGIHNLFREHTEAVLGAHQNALGITYAESTYGAEAQSMAMTARGGYCVYLTNVDVDFGWRRMQVYIASEFQPGSCEYNSVLDHENQHVSINNAVLKEFAPRFRAEVERILRTQQPVFSRNAEAGMDLALKAVNSGMSQMLSQFQNALAARNAPLDSASNYDATGKLCANWNQPRPRR